MARPSSNYNVLLYFVAMCVPRSIRGKEDANVPCQDLYRPFRYSWVCSQYIAVRTSLTLLIRRTGMCCRYNKAMQCVLNSMADEDILDFWINVLLCVLGWLPGVIHAWWVPHTTSIQVAPLMAFRKVHYFQERRGNVMKKQAHIMKVFG